MLAAAAVVLAVVAFAGSFDHVRSVVDAHGQHGWLAWAIACMPEASVVLAVLKIRRAQRTGEATGWAWVVGVSAAGFTVSANLATAEHTVWGYVVAAWPAWASIGAAGLIEMSGPQGTRQGVTEPEPAPASAVAPVVVDVIPDDVTPAPEPVPPPVVTAPTTPEIRTACTDSGTVLDVPEDTPVDGTRTAEALLPRVEDAIRDRVLDPVPTAEAIRRYLQCAPKTARALRDLVREPA